MFIKTKFTEKDYINITLLLLFSRPIAKFFVGILIVAILISSIGNISIVRGEYFGLITPLVIFTFVPAAFYFSLKRNYKNNSRLHETIEYHFEETKLLIKGESFSSHLTWEKIPKVTLTKEWLLIWHNRQFANAIPRRDVYDGEINDLKNILTKYKIKNNLL